MTLNQALRLTLKKMASTSDTQVNQSSVFSTIYIDSSATNIPHCESLKAELQSLDSEMKSLKLIINLLNNELKTIRSSDAITTLSASTDDTGSTTPICFNCIQL